MIEVAFQKQNTNDDLDLCVCTASNLPSVTESMEVMRDVFKRYKCCCVYHKP